MDELLSQAPLPPPPGPPWRVVIFDDQTTGMELFSPVLSKAANLKVLGTLKSTDSAISQLSHLRPHLVLADIQARLYSAPDLIEQLTAQMPLPVVLIVPPKRLEAGRVIRAMELGPVSCFERPSTLKEFQRRTPELIELCEQAAASITEPGVGAALLGGAPPKAPPREVFQTSGQPVTGQHPVVALGLSTGGPGALQEFLLALEPPLSAALVVAQHMLQGFMDALAVRLREQTGMEVVLVDKPVPLKAGALYLPTEGRHLIVGGSKTEPAAEVVPMEMFPSPACPSVDVLFESLAHVMGDQSLGLVFTGMGRDGLEGGKRIVSAGGAVWSQSRESCVVWGMPRGVEEAGLSTQVLSPRQMAIELTRLVSAAV